MLHDLDRSFGERALINIIKEVCYGKQKIFSELDFLLVGGEPDHLCNHHHPQTKGSGKGGHQNRRSAADCLTGQPTLTPTVLPSWGFVIKNHRLGRWLITT